MQATTYTLGELVVYAFTATHTSIVIEGRRFIASRDLIPIWPIAFDSIRWPSSVILGESEMVDIARGFSEGFKPGRRNR
jgi:hypothetical protein